MSHWWWTATGVFAYFAARDLVGWSWRRYRRKLWTPPIPGWWRRRKARQDAPWDRALNRNQLR
jgi:hypothetical protein